MPNENLTDKIAVIISSLNHSSPSGDANWGEEGEAKISVIRAALGGLEVSRSDIRATGLMRVIPAPDVVEAEPKAPLTIADAEVAVNAAEIALNGERTRLIAAERNVVKTRAALAETIKAWLAEWPPQTFDTVHRAHVARLQAYKAAGNANPASQSTAGTSPLDRYAAATAAHTRQGGDSFRRNATTRRSLPSVR